MNRRSVLSVSAIAVLGLALLPATAFSQQKSLRTNRRNLDACINQVQVPGREDDRHVWA